MISKKISVFLIIRIVVGNMLGVAGSIYLTSHNILVFDIPSMVATWIIGGLLGSLAFAPIIVGKIYRDFYYYVIYSAICGD